MLRGAQCPNIASADFEIIIVNNGALEDVERIVNQYPQCRYVYEATPGSYAARNAGIAHAKGEIVAFTDTDCIPSPNWLEKGHRYFLALTKLVMSLDASSYVLVIQWLAPYPRSMKCYFLITRGIIGAF